MNQEDIERNFPHALGEAKKFLTTNLENYQITRWLFWDNWSETAYYFLATTNVPKSDKIIVIRWGEFYACTTYEFDFYRQRLLDRHGQELRTLIPFGEK